MRAIVCHAHGPIDGLRLEEVRPPALRPDSARIAVHATGVAFANLLSVQGKHQNRPPLPYSPGNEIAGIVTEIGEGCTRLAVGDRVAAACEWGGYAEEVVVPEETVYRLPDSLSFAEATHLPVLYGTAWGALGWRAGLKPGQTVVVTGAAGGTGAAAIAVARAMGGRVIAVAGGAEKRDECLRMGADVAVDYRAENVRDAVLAATGGRGADIVFDPVGGDGFDEALRYTATEGLLLAIGFAAGRIPSIPANILLVKNLSVSGLYWGFHLGWGKTKAPPEVRAQVAPALEALARDVAAGGVRPRVHAVLPLEQAVEAMRIVESGKVLGKVVLAVR